MRVGGHGGVSEEWMRFCLITSYSKNNEIAGMSGISILRTDVAKVNLLAFSDSTGENLEAKDAVE
jgi:hypothetical protein